MQQNVQGTPPTGPQGPHAPTPTPHLTHGTPQEQFNMQSMREWSKMFGDRATPQEVMKCMAMAIKDAIDNIKKENQKMVEAIKKMRKDQEENG